MGILDAPAYSARAAARLPHLTIQDRLVTEGYPFTATGAFAGTLSGTNVSLATFLGPGITRAFWCESAYVSANKNAIFQINFTANYFGGNVQSSFADIFVGPGMPAVLPVRQLLRPAGYTTSAGSYSLGGITLRTLVDADGTNAQVRGGLIGSYIADDLNFGAEKVYLHIGDSITAGGTGITSKVNQYDWRIRANFRDRGIDVRLVNLSISGTNSSDHERLRKYGAYDLPQVDFLVYSVGANDASQAVSTATYQANVAAMIAHKQARYPNARMLVLGSTPHENNTNETAAVGIRTAAAAAVTAAADPKVTYLSLGSAFDRAVASNYASTDTAGSRIHPSDAGHAAIGTVLTTYLTANPTVAP